jgi:hypothetical protein
MRTCSRNRHDIIIISRMIVVAAFSLFRFSFASRVRLLSCEYIGTPVDIRVALPHLLDQLRILLNKEFLALQLGPIEQ